MNATQALMPNSHSATRGRRWRPRAQDADHHERPDQVELLFDGERPQVAQRHERLVGGVALTDEDLVPVAAVEDAPEEVATGAALGLTVEQRHVHRHRAHHHHHRRQQAPSAAHPELAEGDPTVTFVLADQQQRDQIAADHEEDLDPEEATAQPGVVGVVDHHRDDGDGAQPVEPGHVRHTVELPLGRGERARGARNRPCAHRTTSIADMTS